MRTNPNRRVVCGVDISMRGLGLVALAENWDNNWSAIPFRTVGRELTNVATTQDQVDRIRFLAQCVLVFCRRHRVTDVWIEGYSFKGGVNFRSTKLEAEVGGAIKVVLWNKLAIAAEEAPLSSARKMVLGKIPRGNVKELVHATVRSFGAKFETGDEIDAWVAANYGIGQIGGCCTCHPEFAA